MSINSSEVARAAKKRPSILTKREFHAHVAEQITPARFMTIMEAARASTVPEIYLALADYDAVQIVERDLASPLLGGFVALNIGGMTLAELSAIVVNWPEK